MRVLFAAVGLMIVLGLAGAHAPAVAQEAPDPQEEKTPSLTGDQNLARKDELGLSTTLTGDDLWHAAKKSYNKGFEFLLSVQNNDGSWGSHHPKTPFLKDFGFKTGNRGSNDGVRVACTAIILKAFLRKEEWSDAEQESFDRALVILLSKEKFAYEMGEAFNTWGYGYKLDFLCDLLESDRGVGRRREIAAAAAVCIDGLKRFQQADGGWNYYAGPMGGGQSMSFNTANFAEALYRAEKLGLKVPKGLIEDPKKLLLRMKTRRGGIVYDARFLHSPRSVNELSSGSRTAAVAEALAEMGVFSKQDLLESLAVFNEGENYLEDGRKLIVPHTAVHQISGYFFFYGYHYLSEFCHRLGKKTPHARWERSAWTMVRTQEGNGCWWDTPAADYGDKWGTGFALLVLQRYFENANPPSRQETESDETQADPVHSDTGE